MDRVITLSDLFDCKDKGDLQEEWAELGIIVHECLDNGVTVSEIHEYIDKIFQSNQQLAWFDANGRMDD